MDIGTRSWDFDCNNPISCPKTCSDELYLAGNQHYSLLVKTANEAGSASKVPIYVEFIGTEGRSPKKLLSETGFAQGEPRDIEIITKDVGTVYGVVFSMYKSDDWIPDSIVVKRSGKESSTFQAKGQSLKCPLQCTLTIMNPKPGEEEEAAPSNPEKGLAEEGGADDEGGSAAPDAQANDGSRTEGGQGSEESSGEGMENSYSGNGLSPMESKKLLELGCEDKVKDNEDFGPKYASHQVNYEHVIAKCPNNCWKSGSTPVFGSGIHPEESSICRSAIADRSMPPFGGLIGIGVMTGLSAYEKAPSYMGLEIKAHKASAKSFITYKVDNPDFMSSDVRILDQRGTPSHIGRLEFRLNGVWGTVCSKKMTNSAAKRICRQLKYQDGSIKGTSLDSSESTSAFCRTYKGEDFCGPTPMPIHYMAMNCDGNEGGDVMRCYREIADKRVCNHDDDAIIECTNVDYENPQDPVAGTVRLVDEGGSPALDNSGRLEVYMGEWGSICHSKFSDKAAHVACRQMGYLTGKILGAPGETGFCMKYKGKHFCGAQKILLNEVDCKGTEQKLKECGGSSQTSVCNHEQDILVSCEGTNGDPSGKSQLPKVEATAPQFGKLPLLPIVSAKCNTKFNEPIFRGDPGSIFLINCPENCLKEGGIVWGTGIYTHNSAICRAAIHAGVLQDEGGLVEVIKKAGVSNYEASTNRLITSTAYAQWPVAFTVARPNALAIKLSQSFKGKEPEQPRSFLELGEKAGLSKSSSKPVFTWFPPMPSFTFDGKSTRIKTQGMADVEKTNSLTGAVSIALKLTMKKPTGKTQTLVSHSACGGFELIIKQNLELAFGQRCSEGEFNMGYYLPIGSPTSVVVNFDGKVVEGYVNGMLVNREKKSFNFKLEQNLDIGSFSGNEDEFFDGQINYLELYDSPIPQNIIKKLAKDGLDAAKKGNKLKNIFTVDNRLCISDCTKNPVPGAPGSAAPPADAQPNQGDYPESNVSEGLGEAEGTAENASGTEEKSKAAELKQEELNQETTDQLKCELEGNDKRFEGPTGKTFRLNCPKNCAKHPEGNVFGSLIYSDDSSVCKAAIHAGFIKNEEGGEFLMEIANGLDKYESAFKNDIASAARGAALRSISFKEASPLMRIGCEESAGSSKFVGGTNAKFTVECAPDCSKASQKVFGLGPFTDDSSICQAAILAGVLTDKGGEVAFMIAEGQSNYKGGVFNGVKSVSRENFIRSFKVLGSSKTACHYFNEKYEDINLLTHWKVVNAKGLSTTRLGSWSFNANPIGSGLAFKEINDVMGSEYNYGTSLVNKEFECGEGVFQANVYMDQPKQAALLFRYADENNFYAVEMNQPGDKKLRLVKKSQGTGTVIKGLPIEIEPKEWYRFKILFHQESLQVWLQKGMLRNMQLLFNVTDGDVQRGTVGLASQGNPDVYFDGVGVHEYDPKYGVFTKQNKEQRLWDNCLTGADQGKRKKFCKGVYGSYTEGRKRCEELHKFCEICCDRTISPLENVLNHACWTGCVKVLKY